MEIQNLTFIQNKDINTNVNERKIQVYGTPYHCSKAELIELYEKLSLEKFLAQEARHGIGNYAIVDFNHQVTKVITSTSYCGGYFHEDSTGVRVGTTLKSVLPKKPIFDEFGLCFFLTSYPKTAFSQMPLSTVFKDIYRIPPASVFEFSKGIKTKSYLYLSYSHCTTIPISFEDALWEVAEKMSAYFRKQNIKPVLFFSGGADCLVLYLALAHLMGKENIRVITMQTLGKRSKSNGHERAIPVARNCNMELEILPDNSLTSENVAKLVASMMRKDMIGSLSPHLALEDYDVNAPIIHGQNMDAVALNTMDAMQFNLEKGYLTDAVLPKINGKTELKQYKAFVSNLVSTEEFLNNIQFQKTSAKSFAEQFGGIPDPEPGGKGVIRGLLTSQFPNVLPYPKRPASHCKMLDAANREIELYENFVDVEDLVGQRTADVARFCTYAAIASKRLTTFPISSGSRPELLAMSGPITSYFIGKKKGLLEASQPKREIYDFIEKMTGKTYSELVVQNSEDRMLIDELKVTVQNEGRFLSNYSSNLKTDKSKTLNNINEERITSNLLKLFQKKTGKVLAISGPINSYFKGKKKGLLGTSKPEREIYDFIEKMTSKTRSELVVKNSEDRALLDELKAAIQSNDRVLSDYSSYLEIDNLRILNCIDDERIKSNLLKLFQEKIGKAPGFERQVLNLELLLTDTID